MHIGLPNCPMYNRALHNFPGSFSNHLWQCSAYFLNKHHKVPFNRVSDGEVFKVSLFPSQLIQSHIAMSGPNLTTFLLFIKLNHTLGSSKLIQILHEHWFINSYDDVLSFRTSEVKFVTDNAATFHKLMGLSFLVFWFYGSFDILIYYFHSNWALWDIRYDYRLPGPSIWYKWKGSAQSRFG